MTHPSGISSSPLISCLRHWPVLWSAERLVIHLPPSCPAFPNYSLSQTPPQPWDAVKNQLTRSLEFSTEILSILDKQNTLSTQWNIILHEKGVLAHTTTWTSRENVRLSERCRLQKATRRGIPFL